MSTHLLKVLLLVTSTASPVARANPPGDEPAGAGTPHAYASDVDAAASVPGTGARPAGAESGDRAYPLRHWTEVTMLWSVLTRKPFSAEGVACDYLEERNFEREHSSMMDAELSCGSDEFTRHDRIAAVVPHIEAEYAALSKVKEYRLWLSVPKSKYDFKRGGYATGLSDRAEASFSFWHSLNDTWLVLENAGRLSFVRIDETRARELGGGRFWLFELTIRPIGFKENSRGWRIPQKYIKARIVRARLFTTEEFRRDEEGVLHFRSTVPPLSVSSERARDESSVLEWAFDSGTSLRRPAVEGRR